MTTKAIFLDEGTEGTGLCPDCLDVVLDTSKIILLFRVTYLFAIPLVNDISILYVFQP